MTASGKNHRRSRSEAPSDNGLAASARSLSPAALRMAVVSLFPELFSTFLRTSLVQRAIAESALLVHLENLRNHGIGKHRRVDDTPYGGGPGMVMRVDCLVSAIEHAEQSCGFTPKAHRVLLTPQGARFDQKLARRLVTSGPLVVICGRYEGYDERVRSFVDEEISLGDFVMTGGEVAAMAVIETCIRLLPNVLGNAESGREESFGMQGSNRLEYPQYTRPWDFRDREVPPILKTGDHARIDRWREEQSLVRTQQRRPDLRDGSTEIGDEK